MNNEFICKAALATVNYIDDLNIISVTGNINGFYDLRYVVNIDGRKYKHGGQLKIEGDSVIGGFYDAKGELTPMVQQHIKFQENGEALFIISTFNGTKEERTFSDWAIYKKA